MNQYLIFVMVLVIGVFGMYYDTSQSRIETLNEKVSNSQIREMNQYQNLEKLKVKNEIQIRAIENLIIENEKTMRAYKIVLEHTKRIKEENKSCSTKFS